MAKSKKTTTEEAAALGADVAEASTRLTEAKQMLADAQAEYDEALAAHQTAVKALQPDADPDIHVLLEGADGRHTLQEHPDAKSKLTRITVGGKNYEHVSEGDNGVWVYRRM